MRRAAILVAVALGACGSFEDPNVVIDLRYVAMTAEPPEQVFPFDPANPPETIEDLGLVDFEVCATVADPAAERRLDWVMHVCGHTDTHRCDDADRPLFEVARGTIDDPDTAATAQRACGTVHPDAGLLLVLRDAIDEDTLAGFGGVDVRVDYEVTPVGGGDTIFGSRGVRFAPKIPDERIANTNPTVAGIDIVIEGRDPVPLPLGRCADLADPVHVAGGEQLHLTPVEPEGVREDYVVPTLDGGVRMFTELISYQWLATDGSWTRGSTGGARDISGTLPPLDTKWRAPDDLDEATPISLWIIQRDERLGLAWFESCVVVDP